MSMELIDFITLYPSQDTSRMQSIITSKQEFREFASGKYEPPPKRGQYFKHQRLIQRFLNAWDRLLLFWQTGTGKSCGAVAPSEKFKKNQFDAIFSFFEKQRTLGGNIKKAYAILKGPKLVSQFKYQLVCKCTPPEEYQVEPHKKFKSEAGQKSSITRDIHKWYTIETFETFARSLEEKSDQTLIDEYSDSIFFCDEIHEFRIDPSSGSNAKTNRLILGQFHRLFHLIKRSKVILSTATPMINTVNEIVPIMNIILSEEKQLDEDRDYSNATLEEMREYFNGLISYVRAFETGAIPIFRGVPIKATIRIDGRDEPLQTIVEASFMSDFHMDGYRNAILSKDDAVYTKQRQAANFIFPDGSWGTGQKENATKGFNKYFQKLADDEYILRENHRDEFVTAVTGYDPVDGALHELSCKFARIVKLCTEQKGSCFAFTTFVEASGAAVLAACFEANGKVIGSIDEDRVVWNDEGQEVGIVSNDGKARDEFGHELGTLGPDGRVRQLYERFTESRSIFLSEAGQGILPFCSTNVRAERQVRIPKKLRYALVTGKTPTARFEAIMEAFNSYENRHGELIKVLIGSETARDGLDLANVLQIHIVNPEWNQSLIYQALSRGIRSTSHIMLLEESNRETININIYKHVALVTKDIIKDDKVTYRAGSSIDLAMYERAEQKDREIKKMERIMKQCAFDCYIHKDRNKKRIGDVDGSAICDYDVCDYPCVDPEIAHIDYTTYDVYYADELVDKIIKEVIEIFSKEPTMTREKLYTKLQYPQKYIDISLEKMVSQRVICRDRFGYPSYLQEEGSYLFLQRDFPFEKGKWIDAEYSNVLVSLIETSLDNMVREQRIKREKNFSEDFKKNPNLDQLKSFTNDTQIALLEESVFKTGEPWAKMVLEEFKSYVFTLGEPLSKIQEKRLEVAKEKVRGRKPKVKKPKIVKIRPDEVDNYVIKEEGEKVIIHTLQNFVLDRTSYNVTTKHLKVDKMRIYKPSEKVGWRDTNDFEFAAYNEWYQIKKLKKQQAFDDFGIYGSILAPDYKFRIHDRRDKDIREDSRNYKKGQVCSTMLIYQLIDILVYLEIEPPEMTSLPPLDTMIASLESRKLNVDNYEDEEIIAAYKWLINGPKREGLCEILYDYLKENNQLFQE